MSKEENKESDLEEELQEIELSDIIERIEQEDPEEQITENEFNSFMQRSDSLQTTKNISAPVLERVEGSQTFSSFEEDISQSPITTIQETNVSNAVRYSAVERGDTFENPAEKQYSTPIRAPILRPTEGHRVSPGSHLLNNPEMGDTQSDMNPRRIETEFISSRERDTLLPFEQEDKKYEKFIP